MSNNWAVIDLGDLGTDLPYHFAVQYTSPVDGKTYFMQVADCAVAFSQLEAANLARVLNRQVDDTLDYLINQLPDGETL